MKILKNWIKKLDESMIKKANDCGCCNGSCEEKPKKESKKDKK